LPTIPRRLKDNLAGDRIILTTADETTATQAAQVAERIPTHHEIRVEGTTVHVRVPQGTAILPEFLRALDTQAVQVLTAEVKRPTLDDVFLNLTGRSLRESENVSSAEAESTARSA
jgi:ABC-2 type transport system ATP-binding protein